MYSLMRPFNPNLLKIFYVETVISCISGPAFVNRFQIFPMATLRGIELNENIFYFVPKDIDTFLGQYLSWVCAIALQTR